MACDEMKKVDNVTYVTGSSSDRLYINSGSSKDWAYDAGVPLSYTIELRDTGFYGFLLPPEQILATAQEFTVAMKVMMDYSIENADDLPTTVSPSTMEPSTMEPSTMEPSTMEPSTIESSTMESSTTMVPVTDGETTQKMGIP